MERTDLGSSGDEWRPEVMGKVTRNRAAREAVCGRYPKLFAAVGEAIFRHDPIGINFGTNEDEYDAEAATFLPRLNDCTSVEEVEKILHEEFSRWFGADIAGDRARYSALAKDVWALRTERSAESDAAPDRGGI